MSFNLGSFGTPDSGESQKHTKVLVIGSGPAGLSAALYAARAELSPIVLTGMEFGGQASLTHTIENYPGFPDGVGGSELGELFQRQAERFGAKVEFDIANSVDFNQRPFKVATDSGEYTADSIIIATGARSVHLDVPGEQQLTGKGVSYCATCDGWFFKDKKVVVVGGGDSAIEEALFLTRFASSITIIHRRDTLRAGKVLQTRAFNEPKIDFLWETVITEIVGTDKIDYLKLKNLKTGEESEFLTDGLFIFIGHSPNSQMFNGQLEMDDQGYVISNQKMETSIPGVYVAGEITDSHFKQVVTSAGMGAAAAIQATHYLESIAQTA
ncbi:MAG TPA: thioredoxin-disulfide reductase [Anaerolineales bacterium]|nr:thioredoxin-disulfide reductase [Anaerolineales bacterium]